LLALPFSEETIREDYQPKKHNPPIEGNDRITAVEGTSGTTGCFVTSLNADTAPFLLALALGKPTRFDIYQIRGTEKRNYPDCWVNGYELRIGREQDIKLRLDVKGVEAPKPAIWNMEANPSMGKRFHGGDTEYIVDGLRRENIYGITLSTTMTEGVGTLIWIHRSMTVGEAFLRSLATLKVIASIPGFGGWFRLHIENMMPVSDETRVDCADAVIGPIRYWVNGTISFEVAEEYSHFNGVA